MFITVKSNHASDATYPLGPAHMLIGRDPACDIRLADLRASRRHACIHRLGSQFEIEDLRSGQGTVVNGQPVSRHQLKAGDNILVGDTEIAVENPDTRPDPETHMMPPSPSELLHDLRNPLLVLQFSHQSMQDLFENGDLKDTDRKILEEQLAAMKCCIDQIRDLLHSHGPTVP